jgi:hypothetical protein
VKKRIYKFVEILDRERFRIEQKRFDTVNAKKENLKSGSSPLKDVAIILPKAQNISTQYTSDVTPD